MTTPDRGTEWFEEPIADSTPIVPVDAAHTPRPALSNRAGVAGVIAAAILAGGGAGIGGAAWYSAWSSPDQPTTTITASTAPPGDLTKASTVEQVAARVLPSVVKINVIGQNGAGSGSGIILTDDGKILTNNHVVTVAGSGGTLSISLNNGRTYPATLVGTDPLTDSAVIQAKGVSGLVPATMGHSSSLRVGQPVVAIGSPYGLSSTVTQGIVSALNRPVSVSESNPNDFNPFQPQQPPVSATYPAIQTDAAINPGNSGGALVDLNGQVVGMNSSIQTASSGSTGSVGLGFAIPIDELLPIVNQIINHETPTHARLGVQVGDASGNAAQQGAVLRALEAGGAAQQAGLRVGDVITAVDNSVITNGDSLIATIRGHRPGEQVSVTYQRAGHTATLTVTLGSDATSKNS